MLLEIKKLHMKYRKAKAPTLEDLNFGIGEGEFVVILGLSGAGKSTLIRCLNLLIQPTGGEIYWRGRVVNQWRGKALKNYRRSIGMIFQSFNLIGRLSALTNVLVGRLGFMPAWRAFFRMYEASDVKLANEALHRVGLTHVMHQRADQLSGGQRQRVAIARALVQKPMLILADEPVASLDPLTSRSVMDLLKSINKEEQITMVINLHDVELAKQYATRIIGISRGKIVFDGHPQDVDNAVLERIYS
ncbi:phosphonate ABC transporter ATP-binding protein [Ammoniphilus sp. YIM 78166]|uniref:phosphonate ABC transporter ATP-binding protein n=1 Tax=Ammoniphilus sp. YIM 78166 TaxID=1644106 RepID=UPI00106F6686|nr:phosphonate ABC transporter ATP-binding protein [Ammoniphilus sp. YIM 78166]